MTNAPKPRNIGLLAMFTASALVATACADPELSPLVAVPAPVATATIGPEGGVVELPQFNGLGRASLTFPAGALDVPTEITIAPGLHNAPLPQRAFPVGPYVRLEPKGLALNKAAQLTLPVYDEIRQGFGQDAKFVKVWLKGPEKWELYEQVNSGDGFVSIETLRLDVAGAGVKMPVPAGGEHACLALGTCMSAATGVEDAKEGTDATCADAYCIAELGTAPRVPLIPRLVGGAGHVSWLDLGDAATSGRSDSGAMVELSAHRVTSDGTVTLDAWPSLQVRLDEVWDTLRARGAIERQGALSVAQLGGVAHFSDLPRFDATDQPTVALAPLDDGRTAHFTDVDGQLGVAIDDAAGNRSPRRMLSGIALGHTMVVSSGYAGELVIASDETLHLANATETTLVVRPSSVTFSAPVVAAAVTASGRIGVLTGDGWFSVVAPGLIDGELVVTPLVDAVHALAVDGEDFWLAFNNRPAVGHVVAAYQDTVRVASFAPAGSDTDPEVQDAMTPRAMAVADSGTLVVLTRDARFLRVRASK